MRARRGIFIAQDGKSVGVGNNRYESDKPHFLVNLLATPPHMDIPADFLGGTALSLPGVGSTQETIMTIPHGLPYTPEVLIYLYCVTYNGSTADPRAGLYSDSRLIFSGSSGTVADVIYAQVDDTNLKLIHQLETFFGGYTSDANKFLLRLKYYILSNDSHVGSYTTRGY